MLYIEKNNIQIPVSEVSNFNGKEVVVFGNYERDIIFRTKGNFLIQVDNKFLNLKDFLNTESKPETIVLPDTSQYLVKKDIEGLLSFIDKQKIVNKEIVYSNLGLQLKDFLSIENDPTLYSQNQIVYFKDLKRHYYLKDITLYNKEVGWKELYLSLENGGFVEKNIAIGKNNLLNSLYIYSNENNIYDFTTKHFSLYIGDNDNRTGVIIFANNNYSNIYSYKDLLINNNLKISQDKISFKDDFDFVYDINLNSSVLIKKELAIIDNFKSLNYESYNFKRFSYEEGFSLINQGDSYLEIDRLLVKNPSSKFRTKSTETGLFLNQSYRVKNIEIISTKEIYVKANVTGKYFSQDIYSRILNNQRGSKIKFYNEDIDAFEYLPVYCGIGDHDENNILITADTYDNDASNFYIPTGNYTFNNVDKIYVQTVNGDLVKNNEFSILHVEFYNDLNLNEGDLLFYIENDKYDLEDYVGFFIVTSILDLESKRYELTSYLKSNIFKECHLIKIGNINSNILTTYAKENTVYTLKGINSFNEILEDYFNTKNYDEEKPWFLNIKPPTDKVISALGDLSFLGLDEGLYCKNVYVI